jgi:hypothetical protein
VLSESKATVTPTLKSLFNAVRSGLARFVTAYVSPDEGRRGHPLAPPPGPAIIHHDGNLKNYDIILVLPGYRGSSVGLLGLDNFKLMMDSKDS